MIEVQYATLYADKTELIKAIAFFIDKDSLFFFGMH